MKLITEILEHGGEFLLRIKEIFSRCKIKHRIPQIGKNGTVTLIHTQMRPILENYRLINFLFHIHRLQNAWKTSS